MIFRTQRVVAQDAKQSWRPAANSVPQVSVLDQIGRGTASANLLIVQNWEEWLIHKKAVPPFSMTWTGCGVGWTGPDEVQQRQMKGPAPGEEKLQPPVQDGAKLLGSILQRSSWGSCRTAICP